MIYYATSKISKKFNAVHVYDQCIERMGDRFIQKREGKSIKTRDSFYNVGT